MRYAALRVLITILWSEGMTWAGQVLSVMLTPEQSMEMNRGRILQNDQASRQISGLTTLLGGQTPTELTINDERVKGVTLREYTLLLSEDELENLDDRYANDWMRRAEDLRRAICEQQCESGLMHEVGPLIRTSLRQLKEEESLLVYGALRKVASDAARELPEGATIEQVTGFLRAWRSRGEDLLATH
jgi:hypothetical protein